MRSHTKDQAFKQKKSPTGLRSSHAPKILTQFPPQFPVDNFVRAVSNLGFQQVIPPPALEQSLLMGDAQLTSSYGAKLVGLEGEWAEKLVLPPTYVLSVFKKYLATLTEDDPKALSWFYISPVVAPKNQRFAIEHELGIFILGEDSVISNTRLIDGVSEALKEVGITNITLELNSLGCQNSQAEFHDLLSEHFAKSNSDLCEECSQKLDQAQLTMWNCEKSRCQELLTSAPQVVDFLDEECRANLVGVLESVDTLNIPYNLNPFLSGSISHQGILFQVMSADSVVLGLGANYAPWAKYLGKENVPMLAFVTTLEKLLPYVPEEKQKAKPKAEVFLVSLGEMACRKALALRKVLRAAGVNTWESLLGRPGVKNQLKEAQDHGSEIALIVGQKEAIDDTVILRDMRSGMQEIFSFDRIIDEVRKRLG